MEKLLVLNDYMEGLVNKLEFTKCLKKSPETKPVDQEQQDEAIQTVLDSDEFMIFALKGYKLLIDNDKDTLGKDNSILHVYKISDAEEFYRPNPQEIADLCF